MSRDAYRALRGVEAGPHSLAIPGRHEADALTDACPRLTCLHHTRPAAVLDHVERGKITSRTAAYRCPACDAAWLCSWGAPGPGMSEIVGPDRPADRREVRH